MMTKARSFRRRTLTHAELEDYLTDIGQGMEVNPRGYREVAMSECDSTLHTNKAVQYRASYSSASTDEERVRNFCRLIAQRKGSIPLNEACAISRTLMANTKYAILPQRTMFPENYPSRPESIDAKRTLLLGMTAMVSDAEKQRQIDCKLCEDSTKCRVEKSKNKIFPYSYVDIDTGGMIEAEEYERRYLIHLADLQAIKSQKSPRLRLANPVYSPRNHCDTNTPKSISPCAEEGKKRSFDFNFNSLKIGTDKENLQPSPQGPNTPVSHAPLSSPISPCLSSVSSRSSLSTSSTSSSSSSDSASLTPVMTLSARRRLKPSPIISDCLDDRLSPCTVSPLHGSGSGSVDGPCKIPARRVTLSPTTTRMMMLEVLADEAATATATSTSIATSTFTPIAIARGKAATAAKVMAETQSSSRCRASLSSMTSNTSSISSTSLTRSPVFSPSNPFGRAAKATPSRAASLPSYSPPTTSPNPPQRGIRKSCYVSSHDNLDDHSTLGNTEILQVEPSRITTNNSADSDGDYTPDIITGLPDMQFERDRHPDKDKNKNEYLFKNCKGITEKVSVLLKLFETHTDNGSSDNSEEHSLVTKVSDKDMDIEMDMNMDSCSVQTHVTELSGSPLSLGVDNTKECSPQYKDKGLDDTKECSILYKDKDSDMTSSEATSRCIAGTKRTKVMGALTSLRGTPAIPDDGDGESVETVSRQLIHFKHNEAACHRTDVAVVDESRGECYNESCRKASRSNSFAVEDKRLALDSKKFYATPVKKFLPNMMVDNQVVLLGIAAAATVCEKISDDQIYSTEISPLSVPASPSRESTPRIQSLTSSVSGVPVFGMIPSPTLTPTPASASVFAPSPCNGNVIPRRYRDRHLSPPPRPLVHTDSDTDSGAGVDADAEAGTLGVFVHRSDVYKVREILCPTLIEDNSILKLSVSSPMPMPMSMVSANSRVTYTKNGNIRSHKYSVSDAETAQDAEDKAAKRLNIRCQIAHWKYQWELASYQAAKVARLLAD